MLTVQLRADELDELTDVVEGFQFGRSKLNAKLGFSRGNQIDVIQ